MLTEKKHLISLLSYIGIGFIAGAISHGFFSGIRSIVMATIGIVLFLLGEFLKGECKSYLELFIFALMYSIAVGMISGGFQHFLDSPTRSLRIVPIGYLVSLIVYPYKEGLHGYNLKKSLIYGILISIILYGLLYLMILFVPPTYFMTDHHTSETLTQVMNHGNTMDQTQILSPLEMHTTHTENNINDHH